MEGWTHAGGVVMSGSGPDRLFLIIRGSRAPHEWVLPKGHIDPGETAAQTARREVLEETGVEAEVVCPIGDERFTFDGRDVRVCYFAMRATGIGEAIEERDTQWCPQHEAERLLGFETARAMLRLAAAQPNGAP
jgi:8-oxo-dGTP pyrophosphatase MutT (NUDIX family)